MPLLAIMESNREAVLEFNIQQLVSSAGDGNLKDNSKCSLELRKFLSKAPIEKVQEYITTCLETSFTNSGLVLQDLINQLGKRLEYDVEYGLYQGRTNQIGFDGIWKTPDGKAIVVEVKQPMLTVYH